MRSAGLLSSAFLTAVLVASLHAPAEAVCIRIGRGVLRTSPRPVIRAGRVYIPADAFRKIGLWVDHTQGTRRARVGWPDSDFIVDFSVGRVWTESLEDGAKTFRPGKPFVKRRKLMIPLRALIDGRMLTATWHAASSTVVVHRERHWLKWRTENDKRLRAAWPDKYETPI